MKQCPQCNKTYDDSWTVCLSCQKPLEYNTGARLDELEKKAHILLDEIRAIRENRPYTPPVERIAQKETAPAATQKRAENTETQIGKYWLNKIGIISVVAGIAFFISYSFQYLAPALRILAGYICSGIIFWGGLRIANRERYAWYGRSVVCGAWVLAYFTTYAMYHIPASRVMNNQFINLCILTLVVAGMMAHLIRYKSEWLAILVLSLGFATAGISSYASFALIYLSLLTLAAVVLLITMRWRIVSAFALLGTYVTYFVWVRPNKIEHITTQEFMLSYSFLALYWLLFNTAYLLITPEDKRQRHAVSGFVVTNSTLFGILSLLHIHAYNPALKFECALGITAILAGYAYGAFILQRSADVIASYAIAGCAFLTASVCFFFSRHTAYAVALIEIPVLIYIGIRYKNIVYRMAGYAASMIMLILMSSHFNLHNSMAHVIGREIPVSAILYAIAIASCCVVRYFYHNEYADSPDCATERKLSAGYTIVAITTYLTVTYYEIATRCVTFTWGLGALLLFSLGFVLKDKLYRYGALCVIAASMLRILHVDLSGVNTLYRIFVFICMGVVLLLVSFLYSKITVGSSQDHRGIRRTIRLTALLPALLLPTTILAGSLLFPSSIRAEIKLNQREITITTRYIAGETLSAQDAAYLKERNFSELDQALRRLSISDKGVPELYFGAMKMGMRNRGVISIVANYYRSKKEIDKAIPLYKELIQRDVDAQHWDTRTTYLALAEIYKDREDYANAIVYYEKYCGHVKSVKHLYDLATCYKETKQYDKALATIERALKLDSSGKHREDMTLLKSDIYSQKRILED